LLPRELVACDDGSADETIEILEQFARDASFPVQVVRNERRLGYADNFLAAAALRLAAPCAARSDDGGDACDGRRPAGERRVGLGALAKDAYFAVRPTPPSASGPGPARSSS
jgi:hypothetical protein